MGHANNVAAADSAANNTVADVIGNKSDTYAGSSIRARTDTVYDDFHNQMMLYPDLALGTTVTAAGGIWTLGSFTVLVATNAISSPFDIHGVNWDNYSGNGQYQLNVYSGADGAEVLIGSVKINRQDVSNTTSESILNTPILPANTQVKAKLATRNGGMNVNITLRYQFHT